MDVSDIAWKYRLLVFLCMSWSVSSYNMSYNVTLLSEISSDIMVRHTMNGSNPNVILTSTNTPTYEVGRNPDRLSLRLLNDPGHATIPQFDINGKSYTIACWVNVDTDKKNAIITNTFLYKSMNGVYMQFMVAAGGGQLSFQRNQYDSANDEIVSTPKAQLGGSGGGATANKWTHVAVTYDHTKGNYSLYTNATYAHSDNFSRDWVYPPPEYGTFRIGTNEMKAGKMDFAGRIMEFFVIKKVLNAEELNRLRGHPWILNFTAPKIFGEFLYLYENETLEFSCKAEGDPPPDVIWFLNDNILAEGMMQSSHVYKAKYNDKGSLGYEVINNVGKITKNAAMRVKRPLRLCTHHEILNDPTRTPSPSLPLTSDHDTLNEAIWYKLTNNGEARLPTRCIPQKHCGAQAPGWLNGQHPRIEDGVVQREVCFHYNGDCCFHRQIVQVRKCYGGYYVYKFLNVPKSIPGRYCLEKDTNVEYPTDYTSFQSDRSAHALVNHVIHVEDDVDDSIYCMAYCQMTKGCMSYNYNVAKKECDLNKSSKTLSSADFKPKDNSFYYEKAAMNGFRTDFFHGDL